MMGATLFTINVRLSPAQVLYMMLNTRKSFFVSIAFVLFGALMILLFETEVLKADFLDFMNP